MPSWPQLLILIAIIALLFGTKKLRTLGEDLGAAIKGFKKAMNGEDEKTVPNQETSIVENDKKEDDRK